MTRKLIAIAAAAGFLAAGCGTLPWMLKPGAELNLSLIPEDNELILNSVTVQGFVGKFVLATATPRSVIDSRFAARHRIRAGQTVTVRFGGRRRVVIRPTIAALAPAGDALLGADVWSASVITVDYAHGLLTLMDERRGGTEDMYVYGFTGPPSVPVQVGQQRVQAIVDTAIPDSLILAPAREGRAREDLFIAGRRFPSTDIRLSATGQPRLGNRLLSRFLVTIDYRSGLVAFWSDPRTMDIGKR